MPKTPCDYSRTVIYKIQHIDNDTLLYIGSTTDFTKRKCAHKSRCNNEKATAYNCKVYQMIRENGGWEEFKMIQIKEFPCDNKRQADMEEDKIMREMKAPLNTRRAYESKEECRKRECTYAKRYWQTNKEVMSQKQKAVRKANIEKLKEKEKLRYELNKESLCKKTQIFYKINKDEINAKRNVKVMCECGCDVSKKGLTRHKQSTKHIDLIKQQTII
jgi:hypothetical protein